MTCPQERLPCGTVSTVEKGHEASCVETLTFLEPVSPETLAVGVPESGRGKPAFLADSRGDASSVVEVLTGRGVQQSAREHSPVEARDSRSRSRPGSVRLRSSAELVCTRCTSSGRHVFNGGCRVRPDLPSGYDPESGVYFKLRSDGNPRKHRLSLNSAQEEIAQCVRRINPFARWIEGKMWIKGAA